MIIDKADVIVENSESSIAFYNTDGGPVFEFWDRYITVEGKKLFHIGVACSECTFSFERIDEDSISINSRVNTLSEDIIKKLDEGLTNLEPDILDELKKLMPNGRYRVLLSKGIPILTTPHQKGDYFAEEQIELVGPNADDLPHYTRTKYYRFNKGVIKEKPFLESHFFEFIIPFHSVRGLNKENLSHYLDRGTRETLPTAVALSVLTRCEPPHYFADNVEIPYHTFLTHYLIEGWHKAYAAALAEKPLTLISFLALDHGDEYTEDIESSEF